MNSERHVHGLDLESLLGLEWLTANGIGGYACSTVPALNTRKYHGLLVAAMAPPVRRMVLLSRTEETLFAGGHRYALDCNEYPGVIYPQGHQYLQSFDLHPCPIWTYAADGWRVQKRLRLLRDRNAVVLSYQIVEAAAGPIELEVRPLMALRPIHDLSYQWNGRIGIEDRGEGCHHLAPTSRTPEVFLAHTGQFQEEPNWYLNQIYRREQQRGYSGLEDLWTPGVVRFRLGPGAAAHLVCSADPISLDEAVKLADEQHAHSPAHPSADPAMDALRRAAESFVVSTAIASAASSPTMCMSGYPWPAPAVRDVLIGFTGLLLISGKFDQAKSLLLLLSSKLRNGLIPSHFPEDGSAAQYLAADVSLWFVNAVWNYLRYSGDDAGARRFMHTVLSIVDRYRVGTDLGIAADSDGLLSSRLPGVPTSWMDAKIGEWVVTPRGGRPVELNALWYNAVRIAVTLSERYGRDHHAGGLAQLAENIQRSFNQRFWNQKEGCCFDVIDDHGQDPSVRPNQLLAVSLPFAVLDLDRHEPVLRRVKGELLTPVGVRTLSPSEPGYQGRYEGGVVSRDRAHHNGSAFPWLLGPYVTGMLRLRGRNEQTRRQAHDLIRPCIEFLMGDGLGQLCELFDGDVPHAPGGAIASAASVGEVLRCYAEDVLGLEPQPSTPQSVPVCKPMKPRTPRVRA